MRKYATLEPFALILKDLKHRRNPSRKEFCNSPDMFVTFFVTKHGLYWHQV